VLRYVLRNFAVWSHVPVQEELFPRPPDAMQLDHNMIEIEVSETTGDRGRDLQTIREDIYENAAFNANLEKIITNTIEMAQPEANRTWAPVWIRIKELVFEASINETRRKNRERNAELADKKARRNGLKEHIDKGTATPQQTQEYIELTEEINTAATRTPLSEKLEEVAYTMGKQHDTGSAAFHRRYSSKGAHTWVDSIRQTDWSDLSNPIFSGRVLTDPKSVCAEIKEYWAKLYARKPTEPQASRKCLSYLRDGNRVLPPTAAECGAPVGRKQVREVCNHLPTGKSAGPDRIREIEASWPDSTPRMVNAMGPVVGSAGIAGFRRASKLWIGR
jgi:hypothetical protein